MSIRIATTDAEVAACYPVMKELRPQVREEQFLTRVRNQESAGYRIACVLEQDGVVAVAGFRVSENLAWGNYLYIDDFVTHSGHRCKGYGTRLFSWLKEQAAIHGCEQIHLDSGAKRKDAHRFYERNGLSPAGFHFCMTGCLR